MLLVLAAELTRGGDRSRPLQLVRAAVDAGVDIAILLYGIRAYPLLDPTPIGDVDIEALADQLSMIPPIEGPSEPYRPIREGVNMALEYGYEGDAVIAVFWSAGRQPRVPVWLQGIYADNAGIGWHLVLTRPSPPRWIHRVVGEYDDRLHVIRKTTSMQKMLARILSA